jgi:hypothetical protein
MEPTDEMKSTRTREREKRSKKYINSETRGREESCHIETDQNQALRVSDREEKFDGPAITRVRTKIGPLETTKLGTRVRTKLGTYSETDMLVSATCK